VGAPPPPPEFPDWIPDIDEQHRHHLQANLTIDPETRICTVGLEGPAEWILRFIQSNAEEGLIKHLKDEAAFDRLVAGFNDKPKDTTGEEND
jgi:hypothetical protein